MEEEEMSFAAGDSLFLKKDDALNKVTDDRSNEQKNTIPAEQLDVTEERKSDVSDNEQDKGEIHAENFGETNDSSDRVFEDSPLSKSVDFLFETKFVMLNFMSLVPPDIYRGHISASPDGMGTEPELAKKFMNSERFLSKSKSFDTGLQHRKPHLKLLGKLKSMQRTLESPASEDNVNYHYQNNLRELDSPDGQRCNSDPCSLKAATHVFEKSQSAHEFGGYTSPSLSPQKSIQSPLRQYSDVSSSGEFSYMSDADDEFEDYSNASSIFSARSISSRAAFLDLRRSVHAMPTLPSQSEEFDEPDGFIGNPGDSNTQNTTNNGNLATLPEALQNKTEGEAHDNSEQRFVNVESRGTALQTADRTKLKLNIPCEPVQLDDVLLSLQTELSSELEELESEFEEALQSTRGRMACHRATPLTPQTEAARVLARIGDEVKEQYGARLAAAVSRLTYQQINSLSYQQYRDIADSVICGDLPGWRQVALLMVFGQKIIWGAVQQGHTHFGNLIDYSSQLVADVAADFIIKQGGWRSVMNFDPSSDTQSSGGFDTSPEMVVDYFTSNDVTQVVSEKSINNDKEQSGNKNTFEKVAEQVLEPVPDGHLNIGETDTVEMQTLPIEELNDSAVTKRRYASSVGFDFTDNVEDSAEADNKSEGDDDVAFNEPEQINNSYSDAETKEESHDVFTDEVSNNLNKTNIPCQTKPLENDKRAERQITPDATALEIKDYSVDEGVVHSVNENGTNNESVERKYVSNSNTAMNISLVEDVPVIDKTLYRYEIHGSKDAKVLNIPTSDNSTSPANYGSKFEKGELWYRETDNSNNHRQNKETGSSAEGGDIPAKHSSNIDDIWGPNMNNNQGKIEEDLFEEGLSFFSLDDSFSEYSSEVDSEDEKETKREVIEESQISSFMRKMGKRVAALALAVVVVGISVRLATLNR